jgi:transmembrane sensor
VQDTARYWLSRLAAGDISETEMTQLKTWRAADLAHNEAFERERSTWRRLEPLRVPLARGPDREQSRYQGIRLAVTGAAACAALIAILWNPLMRPGADYATGIGQVSPVTLPDGSTAILDTDSAIALHFTAGERRVELLHGQVWFQVRHDHEHPFRVQAQGGLVEDVGTAFAVRDEAGRVTVSVTDGIVTVTSHQTVSVRAGEQVSYAERGLSENVSHFDPASTLGWRGRRIIIEDMPLSQALAELDRYRTGKILLLSDKRAGVHVSGEFVPDKVDAGVEGLAATQGLTVTHLTPYLIVLR